jgi:hypothetical protein
MLSEADAPLAADRITAGLEETLGARPQGLVTSDEFAATEERLGAALLAEGVEPSLTDRPDALVMGAKALGLLRAVAEESLPEDLQTIGDYLRGTIVSLPELTFADDERGHETPPPDEPPLPGRAELAARLTRLEQAHDELVRLDRRTVVETQPVAPPPPEEMEALRGDVQRMSRVLSEFVSMAKADEARPIQAPATASGVRVTLPPDAVAQLSAPALEALQELSIDPASIDPRIATSLVEEAIAALAPQVHDAQPMMMHFAGVDLDTGAIKEIIGIQEGVTFLPKIHRCQGSAGVADLLVVRQKLKAYELGDFAHVENVLEGESRLREHRRLDRTEETVTAERETETEKERDLQSTERSELQNEATKTLQSQMQLEAGLQVSGSYGPAVSFTSNLNAGFSTSTQESERKASTFSREITEKSAERVRERISEQRVRTVMAEIEETNRHAIENPAGSGHIRGIYRWLNKIYDAQVFNYGQRMMFDYVIPEPAAFWLYAQLMTPTKEGALPKQLLHVGVPVRRHQRPAATAALPERVVLRPRRRHEQEQHGPLGQDRDPRRLPRHEGGRAHRVSVDRRRHQFLPSDDGRADQ